MTEKERLEKIMETEGMNARQFATEIGVQSSTISNIMGDRNRPSLEVLQKVLFWVSVRCIAKKSILSNPLYSKKNRLSKTVLIFL